MPSPYPDITGVLLAGGRALRFGQNKAFAKFSGAFLIERVFAVLQSLFHKVIVVTNTPELYRFLPAVILRDEQAHQGPLGGIVTALAACESEQVFVTACDMPLLNASVIHSVIAAGQGHLAAVPCHDQGREYLMALYSKALLPGMRRAMSRGVFSLHEYCAQVEDVKWVRIEPESATNINCPEDLRRLGERHAL